MINNNCIEVDFSYTMENGIKHIDKQHFMKSDILAVSINSDHVFSEIIMIVRDRKEALVFPFYDESTDPEGVNAQSKALKFYNYIKSKREETDD